MTYSILTLGLPEKLITALQDLIIQCNLNFIASATVRKASRLLEQRVFHLLIIGLDYLRNIHQTDWLENTRHISFVPLIILSSTPDQDINTMYGLAQIYAFRGTLPIPRLPVMPTPRSVDIPSTTTTMIPPVQRLSLFK